MEALPPIVGGLALDVAGVSLADALLPIVVGFVVLALTLVGVHLVLRRIPDEPRDKKDRARRWATNAMSIAIAVVLMVVSLVAGLRVLSTEDLPDSDYFHAGVGFVPGVRPKADPGFVVGLAAEVEDCGKPVDVTLTIAGTAEYFEAHQKALARRMAFAIGVPTEIRELSVGYGDGGSEDVLKPQLAKVGSWLDGGEVRFQRSKLRNAVTSIRGSVANWPSHVASLVLTFEADWLTARGLGTCYLSLPPLTGNYSILGGQDAVGRAVPNAEGLAGTSLPIFANDQTTLYAPYDESLLIRNAIAVVVVGRHEILRSEPALSAVSAGAPAMACTQRLPAGLGTLGAPGAARAGLLEGSGNKATFAIRERLLVQEVSRLDCGARITLAVAGAGTQRDVVLLLVGALFSFGAAVLLQTLIDINRQHLRQTGALPSGTDHEEH